MRETLLRVIHSTVETEMKDVIHGFSRRDTNMQFYCQLDYSQSLLQEESESGVLVSIRVKQLSKPPPQLKLTPYMSVSKLELSCAVDLCWVFYVSASLPLLRLIRFGASSFSDKYLQESTKSSFSRNTLSKSPQVKEFVINYNFAAKLDKNDLSQLKEVMDTILELAAYFLTGLTKANLTLPIGVNIDGFLDRFPTIRSNGDKRDLFKHGYTTFGMHTTISTTRLSSPSSQSDSSQSQQSQERKRRDKAVPSPSKKSKSNKHGRVFEREDEPCTSTTRSPRSDRSSGSDFMVPRERNGGIVQRHNARPRSPPPMRFQDMFTRREYGYSEMFC